MGDERAVSLGQTALGGGGGDDSGGGAEGAGPGPGRDKSKLVRWRAARICGELGSSAELAAWLKAAAADEPAYECQFEMRDAARKVFERSTSGKAGPGAGPIWKQIQGGSGTG